MFESSAGRNRKRPPAGLDPLKKNPVLPAASHVIYLLLCAVLYLCLDHTAESNRAAVFYIFAFIMFDCNDVLGARPL